MNTIGNSSRKINKKTMAPPTEAVVRPDPTVAPEEKKKEKKPNAWREHVMKFRAEHPELKFKEVLQQAKTTYTKKPKE